MNLITFCSPLEQFEIIPLISLYFGGIDISVTNETVIIINLFLFIFRLFYSCFNNTNSSLYLIPQKIQLLFELIYKTIISLIVDNLGQEKGQSFFPILFSIFFFLMSLNLIGLIPYSFTLTSHLIVTFTVALFIFLALNIICIQKHGFAFFSLFLPSGTSFVLALLLVPIEFISYIFKPVSLSIRLFANMMAGHTLLKVIAGFA